MHPAERAHVPERTCLGCRTRSPKRELIRLVRTPAGEVTVDRHGTAPGRGAYVHTDAVCIDRAFAKGANAVFRALRTRANPDAAARLTRDIEGEQA